MIKRLSLFLILLVIQQIWALNSGFEHYYDATVGRQPLLIIPDGSWTVHVICGGYDANFNGIKDPGDEAPSYWKSGIPVILSFPGEKKISGVSEKVMDFDFGFIGFPFRPAVFKDDHNELNVLFPQNGSIKILNLNTGTYGNFLVGINAVALSEHNGKLFITQRLSNEKSRILVCTTGKEITDTIVTVPNASQTIAFESGGNSFLAVLIDGTGQNDAGIIVYKIEEATHFLINSALGLGSTGNHINYSDGKIFATMNATHEIVELEMPSCKLLERIKLPTSGWDGPREFDMPSPETNIGFIPSYNSKVYTYDIVNNKIDDSLDTHGKAEFAQQVSDYLLVANAFQKDGYEPDTTITMFSKPSGIKDHINPLMTIYPNPVLDKINISLKMDYSPKKVELIDITGNILNILDYSISQDIIQVHIDRTVIKPGVYFLRLKCDEDAFIYPVIISE